MYTMLRTRPDLVFSISIASRYCSNPLKKHCKQIKRILRYVLGTLESRLEYSGESTNVVGWSDAEFARDRSDSKSIGGYVFTIGGTVVS